MFHIVDSKCYHQTHIVLTVIMMVLAVNVNCSYHKSGLTKRTAVRASPCGYGPAFSAMALVGERASPVRPAADAHR